MCSGDSRNTLLVTRSIRPRRPVESPEAKSTRRRASDSVIWVRLMMIGVPSRKCSAMPCASRYWRGCTVRISFISGTWFLTTCRFGSGVTVARGYVGDDDTSEIGSTGSSYSYWSSARPSQTIDLRMGFDMGILHGLTHTPPAVPPDPDTSASGAEVP